MYANNQILKHGILLFLTIFLMKSCVTTPVLNRSNYSKEALENQKLMEDQRKTVMQGTIAGALLGAGVGALASELSGNDTKETLIYTAVGALGGGIAGRYYGTSVAERKAKLWEQENSLQAAINQARNVRISAEETNSIMNQEIERLDIELAQLQESTLSAEEKERTKSRILADINLNQGQLKNNMEVYQRELELNKEIHAELLTRYPNDHQEVKSQQEEIDKLEVTTGSLNESNSKIEEMKQILQAM